MNCVRWSMGDASLHGMGTSSVPGQCFGCYPCPWTKLLPMSPDRTLRASNKSLKPTPPAFGLRGGLAQPLGAMPVPHSSTATMRSLSILLLLHLLAPTVEAQDAPPNLSAAVQAY